MHVHTRGFELVRKTHPVVPAILPAAQGVLRRMYSRQLLVLFHSGRAGVAEIDFRFRAAVPC